MLLMILFCWYSHFVRWCQGQRRPSVNKAMPEVVANVERKTSCEKLLFESGDQIRYEMVCQRCSPSRHSIPSLRCCKTFHLGIAVYVCVVVADSNVAKICVGCRCYP